MGSMLVAWKQQIGQALVLRRRRRLAGRYLQGRGIEIGALHSPLPVPPSVHVTYVDHLTEAELRSHYPEVPAEALVPVDRIDDAESLGTFDDDSQDFVVASHLLEHCQDPIGALGSWLRVVRHGGILFLAVPDRRFTFDRRRSNTAFEHLLRDHLEGPEASRFEHYLEWAEKVEGRPVEERAPRAEELSRSGYSIHFHAWDARALHDFLDRSTARAEAPAVLLRFARNRSENLAVLRKGAAGTISGQWS